VQAFVRTILAIACGYIVVVALRIGGLLVLASLMFHGARMTVAPAPWIAANAVVAFVASIIGGGLAARMAPVRPMFHSAALGIAILAIGIFALLFPTPQSLMPQWYEPLVSVLGAAGAIVGGLIVGDTRKTA
jgi:hypothetical protein